MYYYFLYLCAAFFICCAKNGDFPEVVIPQGLIKSGLCLSFIAKYDLISL